VRNAYLDASALVKLVLAERETAALTSELRDVERIYTSELARIEIGRAMRRIAGDDRAHETGEQLLDGCLEVQLDADIRRAAAWSPTALATLDAVHLESARSVRAVVDSFVTYDRQLAVAALDAGFDVRSPGATRPSEH
jgi:predicted nucleic acid-binding protein